MELDNKQYIDSEKDFFDEVNKKLGNKIVLYCVTGSLARDEIIPSWSDIDILMVLSDNYDHNTISMIKDAREKSKIKIGITIYTIEEFYSDIHKDPKTYHAINLIKKGLYVPKIITSKINIDKINLSRIKVLDSVEFSKIIHDIKREFLLFPEFNEQKILKGIYTIMKIICRMKDCEPVGYKDTIECYNKLLQGQAFDITPEVIIKNKIDISERLERYYHFINGIIEI